MRTNAGTRAGAWTLEADRPGVGGPARGGGRVRSLDAVTAGDLRRRLRAEDAERLVERARWLAGPDRALVEAVYRDGKTAVELAELLETDARAVRRRLKRLITRLASGKSVFVAQQAGRWAPTRRRVAEEWVLHGRSLRETARELGLSLHAVRQHAAAINALYEAPRSAHGRSPVEAAM